MGYCCQPLEQCPRAKDGCSAEQSVTELKYLLCPNEVGCVFSRTITPLLNGTEMLYEQLDGKFVTGDLCSFKVAMPAKADPNDVLYLRTEYFSRTKATLIKGASLKEPKAMYQLAAGQTYTVSRNQNFYLLFEALEIYSGEFVFSIWYNGVPGQGED